LIKLLAAVDQITLLADPGRRIQDKKRITFLQSGLTESSNDQTVTE
jgi:hypothetical protein